MIPRPAIATFAFLLGLVGCDQPKTDVPAAPSAAAVPPVASPPLPPVPSAPPRPTWTKKLASESERLGYLKTALRYWYSADWFGSEKRKQEA